MDKAIALFDKLFAGNARKTITALNALLVIGIIIAVLFTIRGLTVSRFTPQSNIKKDLIPQRTAQKKAFSDYAVILKNNPFGPPAGELKLISSAPGPQGSQPVISTDFFLIGTITGPGTRSFGIFVNKEGKQEVFRVGSPVFGAGKLKKVKRNSIVLEINGKDREMELVELKDAKTESGPSSSLVVKREGSAVTLDQRRIQQALENPRQIMTDARFLPNVVNGKQEGFVLSEVKPGGIYSSLGLINGDVILRINEHNISSPDNALQTITALKGMDRVQLDIIRNSNRMTMNYVIR